MAVGDVAFPKNDFFTPAGAGAEKSKAKDLLSPAPSSSAKPSRTANREEDFATKLQSAAEPRRMVAASSTKAAPKQSETSDQVRFQSRENTSDSEPPIRKRSPQSVPQNGKSREEVPGSQKFFRGDEDDMTPTRSRGYLGPQNPQGATNQKSGLQTSSVVSEDNLPDVEEIGVGVKPDQNMQVLKLLASPNFDMKSLTPTELKDLKEALRDQQAGMKQESVQRFMAQLQNQFGITPERVVQAFAKMDESTLRAPPSETVAQFVDNLKVQGPARQKIAGMYRQMLNETGEAALNEKLLGGDDDKAVSLKVMDSTQSKLNALNKSLDTMNDNFFRKQVAPPPGQQLPANIQEQLKKLTQDQDEDDSDTKADAGIAALVSRAANGMAASDAAAAGPVVATPATAPTAMPASQMAAFSQAQGMNSQSDTHSSGDGSAHQQSDRGTKSFANQNVTTKNFTDASKMSIKSEGAQVKGMSTAPTTADSSALAGQTSAVGTAAAGTTAATLSPNQMMMTGPTKDEAALNVQEVINKAQVMIKKGGGEMTVEMKPEGMGQVHLKVGTENGQVNIQMITQNDHVKKLLEDGIHELKANLASHKLQVESLKIGIANGALADKKMDQQTSDAQREMMREAQREMAGNFMGQMRDERQDMRDAWTGQPGWRAYRNDAARTNVQADVSTAAVRTRDANRRLSVIA